MAKPATATAKTAEPKKTKQANPLDSVIGRAWLVGQLAEARRVMREGPGGQGWAFNEALKPGSQELSDFIEALLATLN